MWTKAVCVWRRTPSQEPQARPGNPQLGWHASGLFRSINSRPAFCCYCPIFLSSEHVAEARREGVTRLTPRASERLQEGEQKANKGNRGELPSLYSYPTNTQKRTKKTFGGGRGRRAPNRMLFLAFTVRDPPQERCRVRCVRYPPSSAANISNFSILPGVVLHLAESATWSHPEASKTPRK
ncbi:MAG: hypothetical protein JWP02_3036 [Acidimicrobiales bacterium]|nr:hypothetical protein [Acidimicrobiales bacterium]